MNVNEIIVKLAEEALEEYGKHNWVEVSQKLGKIYGVVRTPNACRKSYKRHKQEINVDEYVKLEKKGDLEISERILKMSVEQSKDEAFVLKAHGYDPNIWEVTNLQSNFWKVQTSEKDLYNYQSKISVKKKTPNELTKEDIISTVALLKPIDKHFNLKRVNTSDSEKYALELDLSDIHIGSLSWHEETGYDNDYKIAFENLFQIVSQAKNIIETLPIEKLYLCFLGDFLHIDTEAMTTTKGTKVDFDSRPKKMLQKGYEIIMHIIDELAIVETEVYWIEGNHSRNLEFAVFYSMPFIYANQKHIKFDVTPKLRKAFTYGDVLVGLHHGELKKDRKFNWLQVEYRKEWGNALYTETHSGHIHHESVTNKGGITERSNPSPKVIDKYEYEEGYVGTERTVLGYIWHKKKGLQQVHYLKSYI